MKRALIDPQVVLGDQGQPVGVFLKMKDFTKLIDELDDLYDVVKAERIIEKGGKAYTMKEVEKRYLKKSKK